MSKSERLATACEHTDRHAHCKGMCKSCYAKTYLAANREKILVQRKAYREANREKQKAYRDSNREKIAERKNAHYEANWERFRAYREANHEKILAYSKAYYKSNRENQKVYYEANREKRKDRKLRCVYGITLADYSVMLESQGTACAICGDPPTGQALSVDHCHTTGRVRGLLCGNCNRAIGLLKDNPSLLRQAADYCERWHNVSDHTVNEAAE